MLFHDPIAYFLARPPDKYFKLLEDQKETSKQIAGIVSIQNQFVEHSKLSRKSIKIGNTMFFYLTNRINLISLFSSLFHISIFFCHLYRLSFIEDKELEEIKGKQLPISQNIKKILQVSSNHDSSLFYIITYLYIYQQVVRLLTYVASSIYLKTEGEVVSVDGKVKITLETSHEYSNSTFYLR